MSWSATSTRFLNPSRDGDSTTALGSLVFFAQVSVSSYRCDFLSLNKYFYVWTPDFWDNRTAERKQVWGFPLITAFPRTSPAVSGVRVPGHTCYFVESFHFTTLGATGHVYWSFHAAVLFLQKHRDGFSVAQCVRPHASLLKWVCWRQ